MQQYTNSNNLLLILLRLITQYYVSENGVFRCIYAQKKATEKKQLREKKRDQQSQSCNSKNKINNFKIKNKTVVKKCE